jgi:hypothetical protein
MTRFALAILVVALGYGCGAYAQTPTQTRTQDTSGKVCRMEQQCHWENFKKICTWVKVCR